MVVYDRNVFVHGIFLFPGRSFHLRKGLRTITFTSSPPSRRAVRQQSMAVLPPPSTITRLPILAGMLKSHIGQPVDTDMDIGCAFFPSRELQDHGPLGRRCLRKRHRSLYPASLSGWIHND